MRLRFSDEARAQIAHIHGYIAERNPQVATAVVERIRAAAELLREFPHIGHEGRESGTREWVVRGLPYIIVYELGFPERDDLMILGCFHGAQDR
jgi:plasmid stabilization system protein ParE